MAIEPRGRSNHLAEETSPYLRQHATNPVDWYPWGADALSRAQAEDRPIFLSIGYAACHWCHVMERESFEDDETAAALNGAFISIKVDREERPDLDEVYMAAVQALTGRGGWPMSLFLTPEGRPFHGGTYFPDRPRAGLPAFRDVVEAVTAAYRDRRLEVERAADAVVGAVARMATLGDAGGPDIEARHPDRAPFGPTVEAAMDGLVASFDPLTGAWNPAPLFPQPMTIELLLRRAASGNDRRALTMARRSLDAMAAGGIHDQLGGGFHRYSTDADWLVPHFEQMLTDNALLARVYLNAWSLTGEPHYRAVALGALEFLEREMRTADGAFAASLDADTGGVEGATFTWTIDEIRDVLGPEEAHGFELAWDVTAAGNWEGRTILRRVRSDAEVAELAELAGWPPDEVAGRLEAARQRLFAARARRPQPARDGKALAGWNGLAIRSLADAAWALDGTGDPADAVLAEHWRFLAVTAADVLLRSLRSADGGLHRSWTDGRATADAVLEDYACLADGLLSLYQATFVERWFVEARQLVGVILERFADPRGGFFDTSDRHERLVIRPKNLQDNALPSGNAMATTVLLRLAVLTGDGRMRDAAERAMALVRPLAGTYPTSFAQWLIAMDIASADIQEVAIVGDALGTACRLLLAPVRRGYRPHVVVACGLAGADSAIELLRGRPQLGGRPTAYVCRGFACEQPVTEPEALTVQLNRPATVS